MYIQRRNQFHCHLAPDAGGCFLFDFPTKGILAEAVRHTQYWRLIDHEGRMPGLAGYWPSRSVTFIDNHDTGKYNQAHTGVLARMAQPWLAFKSFHMSLRFASALLTLVQH